MRLLNKQPLSFKLKGEHHGDLKEAIEEDNAFLSSLNRVSKHETKVPLRRRKKRLPQ